VVSTVNDVAGALGSAFLAGTVQAWIVPVVIFVLVIVAAWVGVRWAENEHLEALASVPLFSGLTKHQLRSILRSSQKVEFSPGSDLVKQGDQGKGCFVLTQGEASVNVDGNEVAKLASGSYFGEMAVLDGGPRSATVTATTSVGALELTRAALMRLIEHSPDVASGLSAELRRRLDQLGSPVGAQEGPATTDDLNALVAKLRSVEHPDWATVAPSQKHWLGLSGLFARGS
jgi:CRP/FNR family transcriptional regulator, cyclic AMP receptor protein